MSPERPDLSSERPDLRSQRPNLRPERPDEGRGQTDRMTDEQKSPCVLQDFVPFGAAAQKESHGSNHRLDTQIPASRLVSQPKASYPSLSLKYQPRGSNHSLKAQITKVRLKSQIQGSNHRLEAQFTALRLKSQS